MELEQIVALLRGRALSGKQAWDKAFHAIESAGAVDATAMVARKDGFMFPARRRVQELLCSMPPEGRDAYRLFNDANAKKLYEQISKEAPFSELRGGSWRSGQPQTRQVCFIGRCGGRPTLRAGDRNTSGLRV